MSSLQESIQVMSRGLVMVSSKLDSFGAMQQPPTHSGMFGSKANITSGCLFAFISVFSELYF